MPRLARVCGVGESMTDDGGAEGQAMEISAELELKILLVGAPKAVSGPFAFVYSYFFLMKSILGVLLLLQRNVRCVVRSRRSVVV